MNRKAQKKDVVPCLRFPEFRDAGEWEVKRLGELTNPITERVGSKKLIPLSITSGVGFVSQTEKFGRDISGWQYQKYVVLKKGQFSYNKGNSKTFPQGSIYQLREFEKAVVPNAFYSFEFKDNYVPAFFKGYFEKNFHGQQLARFITSGARSDGLLNISAKDFFNIILPTPSDRSEQQKIADCLSSLDELIELEARQCEALRQHKKGLMQQLFPREGETTPRLRFPEFRDAGAWEVKRLGKISEVVRGGSPRPISQFLTDKKEGLNWLKIGDILEGAKYVVATQEKIKPSGSTKTREVVPGDLILSNSMSFGRPYIMKIKACIHDGWLAITRISELQTNEFLYYFVMSGPAQQYLHDAAAGGGVRNLNADIVKLLPVSIPSEVKEQQKIADCLSALDELIELQSQKVEALRQHKKGLMQQLFPQEVA